MGIGCPCFCGQTKKWFMMDILGENCPKNYEFDKSPPNYRNNTGTRLKISYDNNNMVLDFLWGGTNW
jgi:hypothetical protein